MKIQFDPQPLIDSTLLIETSEQLSEFFDSISDAPVVAVDIESAGFYKYYSHVNLIQISVGQKSAIIDPQSVSDFSSFKTFAKDSKCTWVFHGGDYDIAMLAKDLDIYIPRMFDTRKAAELLGLDGLALKSLTSKYLGIILDKKLQRCDWSRRPLTQEMKKYAILDAICLVPVYKCMVHELKELNRYDWVVEECRYIDEHARSAKSNDYDPYAFLIKGSSRLSLRSKAVLREVWKLRDRISERIDRAPFMLLSNQAMLEIARQKPLTIAGLSVVRTVNKDFLHRYGVELQKAVKAGLNSDLVGLERPPKTRVKHNLLTPWEGELAKSLREIRDEVANKLGIAPSLLLSTQALYDLARIRPSCTGELRQSEIMHDWQVEVLAEKLIPMLQQVPPLQKKKKRRRRRKRSS